MYTDYNQYPWHHQYPPTNHGIISPNQHQHPQQNTMHSSKMPYYGNSAFDTNNNNNLKVSRQMSVTQIIQIGVLGILLFILATVFLVLPYITGNTYWSQYFIKYYAQSSSELWFGLRFVCVLLVGYYSTNVLFGGGANAIIPGAYAANIGHIGLPQGSQGSLLNSSSPSRISRIEDLLNKGGVLNSPVSAGGGKLSRESADEFVGLLPTLLKKEISGDMKGTTGHHNSSLAASGVVEKKGHDGYIARQHKAEAEDPAPKPKVSNQSSQDLEDINDLPAANRRKKKTLTSQAAGHENSIEKDFTDEGHDTGFIWKESDLQERNMYEKIFFHGGSSGGADPIRKWVAEYTDSKLKPVATKEVVELFCADDGLDFVNLGEKLKLDGIGGKVVEKDSSGKNDGARQLEKIVEINAAGDVISEITAAEILEQGDGYLEKLKFGGNAAGEETSTSVKMHFEKTDTVMTLRLKNVTGVEVIEAGQNFSAARHLHMKKDEVNPTQRMHFYDKTTNRELVKVVAPNSHTPGGNKIMMGARDIIENQVPPGAQLHFKPYAEGYVVLDCKLGVRSFVEKEAKSKKERPDLYARAVKKFDQTFFAKNFTAEEIAAESITKFRWMQINDAFTTTREQGFRIDGCSGGSQHTNLQKQVQRASTSIDGIVEFLCKDYIDLVLHSLHDSGGAALNTAKSIASKFITQLKEMRNDLEFNSEFFRTHEIVGSSLLLVADKNGNCGLHLIDLAKTNEIPKELLEGGDYDHRGEWSPGNHADGFLKGMDNMIACFEKVMIQFEKSERPGAATPIHDVLSLSNDQSRSDSITSHHSELDGKPQLRRTQQSESSRSTVAPTDSRSTAMDGSRNTLLQLQVRNSDDSIGSGANWQTDHESHAAVGTVVGATLVITKEFVENLTHEKSLAELYNVMTNWNVLCRSAKIFHQSIKESSASASASTSTTSTPKMELQQYLVHRSSSNNNTHRNTNTNFENGQTKTTSRAANNYSRSNSISLTNSNSNRNTGTIVDRKNNSIVNWNHILTDQEPLTTIAEQPFSPTTISDESPTSNDVGEKKLISNKTGRVEKDFKGKPRIYYNDANIMENLQENQITTGYMGDAAAATTPSLIAKEDQVDLSVASSVANSKELSISYGTSGRNSSANTGNTGNAFPRKTLSWGSSDSGTIITKGRDDAMKISTLTSTNSSPGSIVGIAGDTTTAGEKEESKSTIRRESKRDMMSSYSYGSSRPSQNHVATMSMSTNATQSFSSESQDLSGLGGKLKKWDINVGGSQKTGAGANSFKNSITGGNVGNIQLLTQANITELEIEIANMEIEIKKRMLEMLKNNQQQQKLHRDDFEVSYADKGGTENGGSIARAYVVATS